MIEGVPNVSGHEADVARTLAAGATKTLFRDRGGIDFGQVRAASAIALHMHQPLIPAGWRRPAHRRPHRQSPAHDGEPGLRR
jgi:hypothetical protein